MKKYDSIDLLKFVSAIFVVIIHTNPLNDINPIANTFLADGCARLAVPLFFLSTSFLYYSNQSSPYKPRKYIKRMLILYLCWFVIMLPITIYDRFITSPYSLLKITFRFIRSFFVTSTFSGSWFLVSCIFCAILFAFIDKLNNSKFRQTIIITLSIISYIICVFTSAYGNLINKLELTHIYSIYESIFANPYTSFLVGIPYFAIGKYLTTNDFTIKKLSFYTIISFIGLCAEIKLTLFFNLQKTSDCYFMLLPVATCIFMIIKNNTIQLKNAVILRKMSTLLFFSHFIWIFILNVLKTLLHFEIFSIYYFTITLILSLMTSKIIILLSTKKHFKWLSYLY